MPDFTKTFKVETDASEMGVGAVLTQGKHPQQSYEGSFQNQIRLRTRAHSHGHGHPKVASLFSRTKISGFYGPQQLRHCMQQKSVTAAQVKWIMKLAEYEFDVIYKKGSENIVADSLSRRYEEENRAELNTFCLLLGTKLQMSTAYHPQSDGQTEVINRVLETYLRCYAEFQPHNWTEYLSWANGVWGGRPPPDLCRFHPQGSQLDEVDIQLLARDQVLDIIKSKLVAAQNRMAKQYNKKHRSQEYEIGQWIYLKNFPAGKIQRRSAEIHKLSARYSDPFKVIERIGTLAYRLQLPESSSIHPVFHVSRLKACYSSAELEIAVRAMPSAPPGELFPFWVLQQKKYKRTKQPYTAWLVEWQRPEAPSPSWEDAAKIEQ
ncbi:uncharacterized protein LOC116257660 [Nymphaea colorata]|nr:uncharacterized protein LOC116257660 [Nymphaea colorata]